MGSEGAASSAKIAWVNATREKPSREGRTRFAIIMALMGGLKGAYNLIGPRSMISSSAGIAVGDPVGDFWDHRGVNGIGIRVLRLGHLERVIPAIEGDKRRRATQPGKEGFQ